MPKVEPHDYGERPSVPAQYQRERCLNLLH